ncbi:MAG: DUF5714 domain-containing protein [Chloroflexota bacterium]
MEKQENCGVCGAALVYGQEEVPVRCHICGKSAEARIYCPQGHYICDDCHRQDALTALRKIISETASRAPLEIAELIMAHPAVPMHGPEHHVIVPAAIITAAGNSGYPVPENALEQVLQRGAQVPGGWCGYFGDCGAGVGTGIAVSALTRATPLTGESRSAAMAATAQAIAAICDDQPRCCKRSVRKTLETAVPFLNEKLGTQMEKADTIVCRYPARNKECARTACPYYPHSPRGQAPVPGGKITSLLSLRGAQRRSNPDGCSKEIASLRSQGQFENTNEVY